MIKSKTILTDEEIEFLGNLYQKVKDIQPKRYKTFKSFLNHYIEDHFSFLEEIKRIKGGHRGK